VGLSQLLFGRLSDKNNNKKKKLLLLLDDDGTNSCIKNPAANDNRTFGLVSDDDYPNSRCPKCTILTIYYNNNNNHNPSENNVDNNFFKGNDHHLLLHFRADYSALTGSEYSATERNASDNDTVINSNNKRPEKNADNNSYSNNNNNRCANSEDNNDNIMDGNFISAYSPSVR